MKLARKKTMRRTKKRATNSVTSLEDGMSFMRKNLKQMLGNLGDSIKGIF